MKKIVIFGMDNTGKTTLGNNLKEYLNTVGNAVYVHSLGNVPLDDQIKFMDRELKDKPSIDFKIFDRFPIIEESIYGTLLRGKNRYEGMEDYCDGVLYNIDLFIYCNPGLDTILNWQNREQMDGVIDHSKELYEAYNELCENISRRYTVKTYNFNTDDYHDLLEF